MTSVMTTSADVISTQSSPSAYDDNSTSNAWDLTSSILPEIATFPNTSDLTPAASGMSANFFIALGMCVGAWGLALFIIVGNLLIVCAVVQVQKLHTLSNMYIASLAVADCLVGAVLFPLGISFLPSFTNLFRDSYGGCLTFLGLIYATVACSGGHMFFVSIDRYLFLIHPFVYVRVVTERKVIISLVVVWCFSFLFGSGVFILNDYYSVRNCNGAEILPAFYTVYISGGLHFFLTLITSYVYFRIMLLALQKWNTSRNRTPRRRKGGRKLTRKVATHQNEETTQYTTTNDSLVTSLTLVTEAPFSVDNVQDSLPSESNQQKDGETGQVPEVEIISGEAIFSTAGSALNGTENEAGRPEESTKPDGGTSDTVPQLLQVSAKSPPSSTEAPLNQREDDGSNFEPAQGECSQMENPTLNTGGTEIHCVAIDSEHQQTSDGSGKDTVRDPLHTSTNMSPDLGSSPDQWTSVGANATDQDLGALPREGAPSKCSEAMTGDTNATTLPEESFSLAKDPSHSGSRGNKVSIATSVTNMVVPEFPTPNDPVQAEMSPAETVGAPAPKISTIAEPPPPPPPPPPPNTSYRHGDSGSSPWKAVKLFLSVFVCFTVFWLPYYIYLFFRTTYNLPQAILDVLVLFGLLNSGVNFIVCAMISRDFRRYFRRRLCWSSCCSSLCGCKD